MYENKDRSLLFSTSVLLKGKHMVVNIWDEHVQGWFKHLLRQYTQVRCNACTIRYITVYHYNKEFFQNVNVGDGRYIVLCQEMFKTTGDTSVVQEKADKTDHFIHYSTKDISTRYVMLIVQ